MRRRAPVVIAVAAVLAGLAGLALARWQLAPVARPLAATTSQRAATTADATASQRATPDDTARAVSGSPVARISIPRIGINDAPIYDRGLDSKGVMLIAPGYAVTHYSFSAPLGTGNAVLYGHDDIQGNIFAHLYDLSAGDAIDIAIGGQTHSYRVTGHRIVPPTDISVLSATGDARLTIITCWPYNVDTKRWIVTAIRV